MRIFYLFCIALIFCSCSSSSSQKKLFIFTWSHFFNPALVAEFEKENDCQVIMDSFDSNESMYAKLKLGASRYDLILPSHYYLEILHTQEMINPVNLSQLKNHSVLDRKYFKTNSNQEVLGVPFIVSFSGIAYRKDRLPSLPATWGVFANSALSGRMTMLSDMREVLGAALKFLGVSINTKEEAQLKRAVDVLLIWKKNLAKFESEQYKNGLATGEFLVSQGFSIDAMQIHLEEESVDFLFPKEGAILTTDYLAIPKNAKNVDLAMRFIDFMIEPAHAAKNMEYNKSLMPVQAAYKLLPDSLKKNPILFPSAEDLEKMEQIEDVGETIKLYYEAWERVKT